MEERHMGKIKDILAERRIGTRGMYGDHARLELMENIHFHWRDSRFVMTPQDFAALRQMFNDAYEKLIEAGSPESCDWFSVLAEQNLQDNGYHATRLGVEEEEDNTIHLHYRDLRMHFKPADFMILAQHMWLAYLQYNRTHAVEINIEDLTYHPIVDIYIGWLEAETREDLDTKTASQTKPVIPSVAALVYIKHIETHSGKPLARPNGLPDWFPNTVDEEDDRLHLRSLLKSIELFGYAEGPYTYQYIRIYRQKDGSLYVKDSHRLACLKYLGYDKIKAVIVDEESGWCE